MARGVQKDLSHAIISKATASDFLAACGGTGAGISLADFEPEPREPGQCLNRIGIIRFARHPSLDSRAELFHQ